MGLGSRVRFCFSFLAFWFLYLKVELAFYRFWSEYVRSLGGDKKAL